MYQRYLAYTREATSVFFSDGDKGPRGLSPRSARVICLKCFLPCSAAVCVTLLVCCAGSSKVFWLSSMSIGSDRHSPIGCGYRKPDVYLVRHAIPKGRGRYGNPEISFYVTKNENQSAGRSDMRRNSSRIYIRDQAHCIQPNSAMSCSPCSFKTLPSLKRHVRYLISSCRSYYAALTLTRQCRTTCARERCSPHRNCAGTA